MARKVVRNEIQETVTTPNARYGALKSAVQTLGTTSQVTTVAIPSWAQGVRLYPNTTALQYAVDEDPVAITAVAYGTGSITADTAFGIGGEAKAGAWLELIFHYGSGGTTRPTGLRLRPATSSSTVQIVFF